jgi:hypothetical protein
VVAGEVVRVPIIEHVPPDTTAVWSIMKGLDPDRWREKTEHKHAGSFSFARLVEESMRQGLERKQLAARIETKNADNGT